MRTKYMVWLRDSWVVFASKYLACARAEEAARLTGEPVAVETLRGSRRVYVAHADGSGTDYAWGRREAAGQSV